MLARHLRARWLAMFELNFDDGGSQNDPHRDVFSVAGYVASESTWRSLAGEWQRVLEELRAPGPYHGTDCEVGPSGFGHGDFKHWNKTQLSELKMRLAPLTYVLSAGVGRSVIVPEYEAEIAHDPLFRQRLPQARKYWPLFFCLEAALGWIAYTWPDRPQDERIAVTFEAGTLQVGTAATVFRWLLETQEWARDTFADKMALGSKKSPELQAADMLAYEVYKLEDGKRHNPPRQERKLLSVLRRPGRLDVRSPHRADYPTIRQHLAEWLDQRDEDSD